MAERLLSAPAIPNISLIMKKTLLLSLPLLLLAACGGSKTGADADSDSIAAADSIDSAAAPVWCISADSVGPVRIGSRLDSIPLCETGLYDDIARSENPDAVQYDFVLDGNVSFYALDFGEGRIDMIALADTVVGVDAPKGVFKLGSPFSRVLELPGVTAEWSGYEGDGAWYWRWQGLWFSPAHEGLSPVLVQRLYNSTQAPTGADFSGTETVGYIGTGLPF